MILYTPQDAPTQPADLFLGGSCVPATLWRNDLVYRLAALPLTLYSPERLDFPGESLEDPAYLQQVHWERLALAHSRAAIFWLDSQKPTSYASRFEIGVAFGRNQPCLIGCRPDFPGATYLRAYAPDHIVLGYDRFCDAVQQLATTLTESRPSLPSAPPPRHP